MYVKDGSILNHMPPQRATRSFPVNSRRQQRLSSASDRGFYFPPHTLCSPRCTRSPLQHTHQSRHRHGNCNSLAPMLNLSRPCTHAPPGWNFFFSTPTTELIDWLHSMASTRWDVSFHSRFAPLNAVCTAGRKVALWLSRLSPDGGLWEALTCLQNVPWRMWNILSPLFFFYPLLLISPSHSLSHQIVSG